MTMAVLELRVYPDDVLRDPTEKVTRFDDAFRQLVEDMRETMKANKGVGLAAPQVGVPLCLLVMEWKEQAFVMANPRIVDEEGAVLGEEGCLSFPDIYENVSRPERVRIFYQDEFGNEKEISAEDYLARVCCHEIDHLNGRLMIDHLSPIKRAFIKKKMQKRRKED